MSLIDNLRQLAYPGPFRIGDYGKPDLSAIKALVTAVGLSANVDARQGKGEQPDQELLKQIAEVGVVFWRLNKRSISASEPQDKIRRVTRDIEYAGDTLRDGEIEIVDHTGKSYDGGMRLRVIAFQETAGISQDRIIETIKPTIYYKGRLIHMGEVIVGTPAE